ncbi:hypothetical protein [Streptomyces sp. NPDC048462]|uniref:hypothetical protein n=1 Tax=Streptomyces sp. NPDC048462 TaxID=3365555 RepID=UPI003712C2B6
MQRGLVHGLAWSLATGGAVTLSWWGVHTVMAGTAYDPPRAVPISASARATTEALSSSTHRPEPSPSPSGGRPRSAPKPSVSTSPTRSHAPAGTPRPTASATATPAGTARSYPTDGGRVVFELGADSAELVSATPEQGWSMRVWTEPSWIRVNFARDDGTTVSVFCTWNGYPPKVEIVT